MPTRTPSSTSCPACGSQRIVSGRIMAFGAHTGNAQRFFPDGLKLVTFRRGLVLERRPVFDACADCGHVWSSVDADALRALVESSGRRQASRHLAAPRPPRAMSYLMSRQWITR